MTATLMEPFHMNQVPSDTHNEELLNRLHNTRNKLLHEYDVPSNLLTELLELLDDSYLVISSIKSNESSKLMTPIKKKQHNDLYQTPADQVSIPENLAPIQSHHLDTLDEEPIEF